jgi:hypothetical protein
MSALCQKQTFCAAAKTSLFDHRIRANGTSKPSAYAFLKRVEAIGVMG